MRISKEALNIEQSFALLPSDFIIGEQLSKRENKFYSSKGLIAFHNSKFVLKYKKWWTTHKSEDLKCNKYIVFALGFEGILLLPTDFLLDNADKNPPVNVGDGFQIDIKLINGEYKWCTTNKLYSIPVQKFFIPNK